MLTYDIQGERLYGVLGNQTFALQAVSGGGRGSKVKPEGDEKLRSWSALTKEDEKRIRGGILPPGFYICRHVAHHPKFHECVYLEQTITSMNQALRPSHRFRGFSVSQLTLLCQTAFGC